MPLKQSRLLRVESINAVDGILGHGEVITTTAIVRSVSIFPFTSDDDEISPSFKFDQTSATVARYQVVVELTQRIHFEADRDQIAKN